MDKVLTRIVLAAAVVLFASPAWASWSLVQSASDVTKFGSGTNTTDAKAFSGNPAANDLLVVVGQTGATSGHTVATISCADTIGNTWTAAQQVTSSTDRQAGWMCWAINKSAASDTVTATGDANSNFWTIAVHEFSGNATSSPADGYSTNGPAAGTTGTNNITSGSFTPAANGDLIFGWVVDTSSCPASIAQGTGFASGVILAADCFGTEYLTQSTAAAIAATFTQGTAITRYVAGGITFKAAAAAVMCTPTLALMGVGRCG